MRKLGKATMAAVLSMAMVMGNVGGAAPLGWNMQQAKAADISYVELNEDFESTGEVYFRLTSCGSVSFQNEEGNNEGRTVYQVSEDGNLTEVAETQYGQYGAVRLGVGTYKVGDSYKSITKVVFTEENADSYEQEWNDTIDTANEIKTNSVYTGNLNNWTKWSEESTTDIDYYKVILDSPGKVFIQYTVEDYSTGYVGSYGNNENAVTLYAEDEDGNVNKVAQVGGQYSQNKTRYSSRYRLPKGTYYVSVSGGRQSDSNYKYADITDYQLKVNYTAESADQYEQEYNNTVDTANSISTNSAYTGNISENADVDYFKFILDKKSKVKLKTTVPRQSTDKLFTFGIYKSNGTSKVAEVKSGTNPTAYTTEKELDPGDYYVLVKKGDADVESAVDYSIQVMATDANAAVTTPTSAPSDSGTNEDNTGDIPEATSQPVVDDDDYTGESEPGAVATRAPSYDDGEYDGEDNEEEEGEGPTPLPPISDGDLPNDTVTAAPAENPGVDDAVTAMPAPSTNQPIRVTNAPASGTNAPAPATNQPARVTTAPSSVTNAPQSTTSVTRPTANAATTTAPTANSSATTAPTTAATAAPTASAAPSGLIDELRMYADVEKDEVLRVGDKFQVYAEAVPDELNEDLEVIWSSSDEDVATVSKKGEVTCKEEGTVTIFASTTDGSKITVSMNFTIERALSKVNTLSKITFTQGKLTPKFTKSKTSYTLTLSKNMSSTIIGYKKTDSAATVKINGGSNSTLRVKLKPGKSKTVKIAVKAENGNSKTYKIKVKRKR